VESLRVVCGSSFPDMTTRTRVTLGIGVVMLLLGAFVALRPLWAGPRPLSASRWLDGAFALFFMLRGWMNVRLARKQMAQPASRP
jgi:hypothetical protein